MGINITGQLSWSFRRTCPTHLAVSRISQKPNKGISHTSLRVMGIETELFVSAPPSQFICAICHDVVHDPVIGCTEGHSYCRQCICNEQRCPLDREQLGKLLNNRSLQSLSQELLVWCRHSEEFKSGAAPDCEKKQSNSQSKRRTMCADGEDQRVARSPTKAIAVLPVARPVVVHAETLGQRLPHGASALQASWLCCRQAQASFWHARRALLVPPVAMPPIARRSFPPRI